MVKQGYKAYMSFPWNGLKAIPFLHLCPSKRKMTERQVCLDWIDQPPLALLLPL